LRRVVSDNDGMITFGSQPWKGEGVSPPPPPPQKKTCGIVWGYSGERRSHQRHDIQRGGYPLLAPFTPWTTAMRGDPGQCALPLPLLAKVPPDAFGANDNVSATVR